MNREQRLRIRKQEKAFKSLCSAAQAMATIPTSKAQGFAERIQRIANEISIDMTVAEMGRIE